MPPSGGGPRVIPGRLDRRRSVRQARGGAGRPGAGGWGEHRLALRLHAPVRRVAGPARAIRAARLIVAGRALGRFPAGAGPRRGRGPSSCEVNFGRTRPMTTITPVRGSGAHPFYRGLRDTYGFEPGWNFNKGAASTGQGPQWCRAPPVFLAGVPNTRPDGAAASCARSRRCWGRDTAPVARLRDLPRGELRPRGQSPARCRGSRPWMGPGTARWAGWGRINTAPSPRAKTPMRCTYMVHTPDYVAALSLRRRPCRRCSEQTRARHAPWKRSANPSYPV